ncbi:SDR family oxidoreductase [Nocardioides zeae]|uniref:SDR family oxidoreductase n=1 Tax=Nocardioides zeae TaxID=1457234 RepID=A0A6P0HMB5_9ACTN|nr:SDR family oxidoreductase [Nocardioides zeae]
MTGAASGLGAATVALLRARGATVVATDRVPRPDDAGSVVADVTDLASVRSAVEETLDRHGRLDAVAHCAGVFRNALQPLHLLDDEIWHETIAVNLTGGYHVAKAALPALMASHGALTLVSSISATFTQPGGSAYAASKAGIVGMADAIAVEYGPRGVRCNSVLPGYMATPMTGPLLDRPHLREQIEREVPLARVADPAEVAEVVAFTLSPAASYVSGHALVVDGAAHLTAMTSRRDNDRMWSRTSPDA